MRINTCTQSGNRYGLVVALLGLVALLGAGACSDAEGTKRVPGAYPPEADIKRPGPAGGGGMSTTGDGDGMDTTGDGDGADTGDAGTPDAG